LNNPPPLTLSCPASGAMVNTSLCFGIFGIRGHRQFYFVHPSHGSLATGFEPKFGWWSFRHTNDGGVIHLHR
jgi:hypothetical protein